jgi:hypothetical protein
VCAPHRKQKTHCVAARRHVDPRLHQLLEASRRSTIGIALRGAHALYLYGFRKIVQDDFCRSRSNRRACAARDVPVCGLDQRRLRALLMRGAREHHGKKKTIAPRELLHNIHVELPTRANATRRRTWANSPGNTTLSRHRATFNAITLVAGSISLE